MAAIFHRAMEIPLWAAVLFAARRANLQPVDQRLGSAHRARAVPQLTAEPASAPTATQFRAARRDTHVRNEDAPERPGIDAQRPNSMPCADDDAITYPRRPEFHDRPGSGKHTADRHDVF